MVPAFNAWRARTGGGLQSRLEAIIGNLTTARPPMAFGQGVSPGFGRPLIMGIVNATDDSFSGDGALAAPGGALARAQEQLAAGADIIDIGGESTRPGARPVTADEEISRVIPVIEALADTGVPISIDSRNAPVMAAAMAAGARLVNDVSALSHDPEALALCAREELPVVLMHSQGTPETMQKDPRYDDVVTDVYDYLEARIATAVAAGIARNKIIIDPGVGFGKTVAHNLALINGLAIFHGLGCPLLLGASRKSFIAAICPAADGAARLGGSVAVAVAAIRRGVQIVRVHDVAQTRQAILLALALEKD